ncbi:DUF4190 domain-containing protein [Microbacterium aurugineum]|uniref:DUF4190 domain-containing protein n=1 Tax=Microbacterium TaxID=33882 RepID=UPI001E4B21D3|nr:MULTISPECIES: DUF4190 domain-containing protein [unclassified Microbacterium]MCE0507682.1 DUF4190 domain-containing protein [Microbacterium sp. KKR3/1]UUE19070.1 DUF4190 domain-containing protein [Microbacterium sp. J1-1]
MSDNRTPSSGDETPVSPPPPPAPPAPSAPPIAPPPQSGPGPAPSYTHPAAPFPGTAPAASPVPGYGPPPQPGYAPPPQPGYAPPPQPGYGVAPSQPGWGAAPVQPGYGPPSAPVYPVVTSRPTSPLAVTSLVCGLAGIVLFWAVIPLLASVAAVITGHMALGQTKRNPGIGGRGMAIAGLILGYAVVGVGVFILVSTIISFLFLGAFSLPFIFAG